MKKKYPSCVEKGYVEVAGNIYKAVANQQPWLARSVAFFCD